MDDQVKFVIDKKKDEVIGVIMTHFSRDFLSYKRDWLSSWSLEEDKVIIW